jgi:two-component system, chemotaxis family, sensor kinase CheA
MDDLTGEFVAETRETLEHLGGQLVSWEADPADSERLDAIFRFVHTVKGSCGFLDLPRIAALAHAAETVLGAMRDGKRKPSRSLVTSLLAIIDRIAQLVDALESGIAFDGGLPDRILIAALDVELPSVPVDGPRIIETMAAPSRTVRIAIERLEELMSQVSDLVLARNELARRLRDTAHDEATDVAFERVSIAIGDVRETVARTRMQPIDRLFAMLPRLVRDTATQLGKPTDLIIEGADVEIDREMVEAIRDPLTHIIRNALDHGIESPDDRRAAGKRDTGTIRVTAEQSGNQVSIIISDDGRGIDLHRLIAKAVDAKVIDPNKAAGLTAAAALDLIFAPGLSTADSVTSVSGRGVGMDIVRANIERLGGSIVLANNPGQGLTITLRAPLTLSIINALIVEAGGQVFALPRAAIEEIVPVSSAALRFEAIGGAHVAVLRGQMLSVVGLETVLGLGNELAKQLVFVGAPGGVRFALGVDRVSDAEELVVRPIAPQLAAIGLFAGHALPDSGTPILLLDPAAIAKRAGIDGAAMRTGAVRIDAEVTGSNENIVLFEGLDGVLRGIRSLMVERIEDLSIADVVRSGETCFAVMDGVLVPAVIDGQMPAEGQIVGLCLNSGDGHSVIYPVSNVLDIAALSTLVPVADGIVEGLAMIDGAAIEILTWPRIACSPSGQVRVAA